MTLQSYHALSDVPIEHPYVFRRDVASSHVFFSWATIEDLMETTSLATGGRHHMHEVMRRGGTWRRPALDIEYIISEEVDEDVLKLHIQHLSQVAQVVLGQRVRVYVAECSRWVDRANERFKVSMHVVFDHADEDLDNEHGVPAYLCFEELDDYATFLRVMEYRVKRVMPAGAIDLSMESENKSIRFINGCPPSDDDRRYPMRVMYWPGDDETVRTEPPPSSENELRKWMFAVHEKHLGLFVNTAKMRMEAGMRGLIRKRGAINDAHIDEAFLKEILPKIAEIAGGPVKMAESRNVARYVTPTCKLCPIRAAMVERGVARPHSKQCAFFLVSENPTCPGVYTVFVLCSSPTCKAYASEQPMGFRHSIVPQRLIREPPRPRIEAPPSPPPIMASPDFGDDDDDMPQPPSSPLAGHIGGDCPFECLHPCAMKNFDPRDLQRICIEEANAVHAVVYLNQFLAMTGMQHKDGNFLLKVWNEQERRWTFEHRKISGLRDMLQGCVVVTETRSASGKIKTSKDKAWDLWHGSVSKNYYSYAYDKPLPVESDALLQHMLYRTPSNPPVLNLFQGYRYTVTCKREDFDEEEFKNVKCKWYIDALRSIYCYDSSGKGDEEKVLIWLLDFFSSVFQCVENGHKPDYIVVVYGRPGSGKTMMARVIRKLCGIYGREGGGTDVTAGRFCGDFISSGAMFVQFEELEILEGSRLPLLKAIVSSDGNDGIYIEKKGVPAKEERLRWLHSVATVQDLEHTIFLSQAVESRRIGGPLCANPENVGNTAFFDEIGKHIKTQADMADLFTYLAFRKMTRTADQMLSSSSFPGTDTSRFFQRAAALEPFRFFLEMLLDDNKFWDEVWGQQWLFAGDYYKKVALEDVHTLPAAVRVEDLLHFHSTHTGNAADKKKKKTKTMSDKNFIQEWQYHFKGAMKAVLVDTGSGVLAIDKNAVIMDEGFAGLQQGLNAGDKAWFIEIPPRARYKELLN